MANNRAADFADALGGAAAAVVEVVAGSATLIANLLGHAARLTDDVVADARAVADQWTEFWDVAGERIAQAAVTLQAVPRFARVSGELLHLIAAYRWHAAVSSVRRELLGVAADAASLDALHERGAARLYALCVEMRGGVLKLGQFVSSRMDLLPEPYVVELSRLQDRVPPVSWDAIAGRMAEELGAPPHEVFAAIEREPIAAASLAQVHAARLADGTAVVVKVQVPGIEDIVAADLAALRTVAPALRDQVSFLDVETLAAELSRAVLTELDYRAEAAHAAAFAAMLAADADVLVPRVHGALSSARVLVLEHVAGSRLTDFLDQCERRGEAGTGERDRVFEILVRCFAAQVLEHGLLHADPHPGNFLVVDGPDGPRVALLDFGCVQTYPAARRRAYAELCLAVLTGDAARVATLFETVGFRSLDGDGAGLHAFAELLLEAFRADSTFSAAAHDGRAAFERVLHLTRDNPIVGVPADFVLLGRVFAVLGGLLMRYQPRINLFQLLMPALLHAVQD